MANRLVIINNESISNNNQKFYCDNIDSKSLPEGLNKNFDVLMIGRQSKIKRSHQINLKQIIAASNILVFLYNVLKTVKKKDTKYLLISITPYTFLSYLVLMIFRKKIFVYLRSDGYEEYKYFLGFIGPAIYHVMFMIISLKANLIGCRTHLLRGKIGKTVSPSQLNSKWFESYQKPNLEKITLLYVGRFKVEKGIFSLLKIFNDLKMEASLTVVSAGYNFVKKKINQKNVKIIDFENENDSIIKIYDEHNIFILPSFTEAHPQVLDETLSRRRPVIIFEEISHVIGNRKGVFVSKRDPISLSKTINDIMNNYESIENEIAKNTLPTKENFLKQMSDIMI